MHGVFACIGTFDARDRCPMVPEDTEMFVAGSGGGGGWQERAVHTDSGSWRSLVFMLWVTSRGTCRICAWF